MLYKSARTCNVCRDPYKPVELHHIDQDPSNNMESNLIVLCRNCHDEAHTKHSMSRNLTPDSLKFFKAEWENYVAQRTSLAMLPSSNLHQAMWTFVNHQRLLDVMRAFNVNFDQELFQCLYRKRVIDKYGIPILGNPPKNKKHITIYDYFSWDDARRLHLLYTMVVDRLILTSNPIELGAIWTKTEIKYLVQPGNICFCMRGFYFKPGQLLNGEEDRLAYARAKKYRNKTNCEYKTYVWLFSII